MKKGRLKRFGVYTLLYVLVTIMAAVSTLAIEGIFPKTSTDSGSAITPVVMETVGEKLINNVLNLGGANVNLSMDFYDKTETKQTYSVETISGVLPKIRLNFSGCINIADLSNIGVNGTLRAVISGSEITLQIAFVNGSLYISNDSMDIKIETASFSKIMEILPLFGVNLGSGMDFSGIDTNQILANLQEMEAVEQEDGTFKMALNLMEGISLDIITDSEYNIKSVSAKELALGNMTANLSAGLKKSESVAEITPQKAETEYVDVTKTLNIMDSVQEIMSNKKLHLDLDASYVGKMNFGVSGAVDVDYNKDLNAYADLNLNLTGQNYAVALGCLGENLLVDFGGMKFLANKTDLMTASEWIATKFGGASDIGASASVLETLTKILPFDISKLLNGDFSDININNLLQFAQGEDNEIVLTINGSAVGIDKNIEVKISLDENDQFKSLAIKDLAIAGGVVNLRAGYSSDVQFPSVDESEYFVINNISTLLPAVYQTASEILGNKSVSLNVDTAINIKDKKIAVAGTVSADFKDFDNLKIYANLNATAMNKTFAIKLAYLTDTIFVTVDNLNFKAKITEIENLVTAITTALGSEAVEVVEAVADTTTENALAGLIASFKNMELGEILNGLITDISTTNTTFAVTLNGDKFGLANDLTVTLGYGVKANEIAVSGLNFNGISAEISAKLTDKSYSLDTTQIKYISLENASEFATAVLNTVDELKTQKAVTLDVDASVILGGQNVAISGSVAYKNGLIYAEITAKFGKITLPITAYYTNDTIYADVSGVKIQLTTQDIFALIKNLNSGKAIAFNLPFDMDEILAGDLSSVSLTILKSLDIGATATKITINGDTLGFGEDIELTLRYTNGKISGVELGEINLNGLTAKATAGLRFGAEIPTLNTTEFMAISNLPNFVPAVISTAKDVLKTKSVSLNVDTAINIKDKEIAVAGTVSADFKDFDNLKIYANLNATAMNKTFAIKLAYLTDTIFVTVDNLNFKAKITEIENLVTAITTALGSEAVEVVEAVADTTTENALAGLIASFKNMELGEILNGLITDISTTNTTFAVTLNGDKFGLANDLTVTLGYGVKANEIAVSGLNFNGISAEISAKLTDKSYSLDTTQIKYISLENASEFATAVLNTVDELKTQKAVTLDVDASVILGGQNVAISGSVAYKNGLIYAEITAKFGKITLPITAYYTNDTIYADVSGVKIQLTTQDIFALIKNLNSGKAIAFNLPFDMDEILAGDLSSVSLTILKSLDIGATATTMTLAGEILGADNDIVIRISYANGTITGLSVKGLAFTTASGNSQTKITAGDIASTMVDEIKIPSITPSDYATIGDIKSFVPAVMDSIKAILKNEKIALNINASVVKDGKTYGASGLVYANWTNIGKEFNLAGLDIFADLKINIAGKEIPLTARLLENELYLTCENLKIRTTVDKISDLVDSIMELLPADTKVDSSLLDGILKGSRLEKILNGDYSVINGEMIKSLALDSTALKISLSKDFINTDCDFSLSLNYGEKIQGSTVDGFTLKGYATAIGLGINYEFTPQEIDADDYEDVTGLNNALQSGLDTVKKILTDKTVAVKIDNIEGVIDGQKINVVGEAYVDFSSALQNKAGEWIFDYKKLKGYANLAIMVENGDNHYIMGHMDGERIYLVYNNLKLSLAVEKIDSLIDVINQMKFITESLKTADLDNVKIQNLIDEAKSQTGSVPKIEAEKVDIAEILATFFPKLDFTAILKGDIASVDFGWLKHLSATKNSFALTVDKDFYGLADDLNISVGYGNLIENASISNVKITDVIFNKINVYLCDNLVVPAITKSDYSSLDSTEQFMNSMLKTAVEVVDNKHISFSLNTQLVHENIEYSNLTPTKATLTHVNVKDGSSARFDWSNAYEKDGTTNKFNIKKMKAYIYFNVTTVSEVYYYTNGSRNSSPAKSSTRTHSIEVTYLDNMIYIKYNNMAVKISGDSIKQIVKSVCGILGIESQSEDLFDNVSALIGSTSGGEFNISQIIDKIGTELIKSFTLTDTQLNGVFDLSGFGLGIDTLKTLNLSVTYGTSGMGTLTLRNLYLANSDVSSVNIGLKSFAPITSAPQGSYMDLSNVGQMLTAIQNTLEFKDFELSGNVRLYIKLNSSKLLDWSVPLNAKIKLTDDGFEANIRLGEIPVVVGVNNDVPYEAGDWDGGKNRYLNIYIKNNMVYLYRTETVTTALVWRDDRRYEKKLAVHLETLMSNPLEYLLDFGLGLSDSIMSEIYKSVNKERTNPLDYSNILKGFSSSGNVNTMTLNLKELAENDKLDTMSLGLRNTTYNGKMILGGIIFYMHMPLTSAINIDLESNELTHINVGQNINMSGVDSYAKSYQYQEGAIWDASNGDWRKVSQEQYSLTFVTGSSQSFGAISGVTGASCTLPTPSNFTTDDGKSRCEYTFAGWYTTKECEEGTQYTQNVIPRKNTTLYAKWDVVSTPYYSVMFDTNCEQTIASMSILSGNTCSLPTAPSDYVVDDKTTERKEYYFAGWYTTPNFVAGTEVTGDFTVIGNIRLYTKWNVITIPYYKVNYICNGSESVEAVYVLNGDTITLPTYPDKKEIKTEDQVISYTFVGWYATPDFADGTQVADEITVSENLTLYEKWFEEVRNMVEVNFVTNHPDIIEPSITALEGSQFTLPTYTQTLITYSKEAIITHEFIGWYTDKALTQAFVGNNVTYGGVTLYALWNEISRITSHTVTVYDGNNSVWTSDLIFPNGEISVALDGGKKLNTYTQFYSDYGLTKQIAIDNSYGSYALFTALTMPDDNLSVYVKNKYTATIKSVYGTVYSTLFTDYQGTKVAGFKEQNQYSTDDGTQTCKKTYTFKGYYVNGVKIDVNNYILPNCDVVITGEWNITETPYYTVTYNVTWTKALWWTNNGSKVSCDSAPSSFRVLAGTTISVNNKQIKATYKYGGVKYNFATCCWKTGSAQNLNSTYAYFFGTQITNKDCGNPHSITINGNTTLYPVWQGVK